MPLQATSGAASYDAFGGGVPAVPNYIEDVFSTYLYTGNGSTQTITNGIDVSGKGGLVWIKNRQQAGYYHTLVDTARGPSNQLYSNATDAQYTATGLDVTAFTSTGFTLGPDNFCNQGNANNVSWTFRKQPKFFDVVTYSGNSVAGREIAHNLGSTPGCVIVKRLNQAEDWIVYHRGVSDSLLRLNTTDANAAANAKYYWGNNTTFIAPTSTVFTVATDSSINQTGGTYVAYLFAHDAGGFGLTGTDNVISCGSYTGNGSTTGPVITLGYEPQWLMVKKSSGAGDWVMVDNMRGIVTGGVDPRLWANLSSAENTGDWLFQLNATGFQPESLSDSINASGQTYIYIAIRRGPMKVPTSGTSVFAPSIRTGTGTTTTVSSTSFPPDLYINGDRTYGGSNGVFDRLRGRGILQSLNTAAENATSPSTYDFVSWGMNGEVLGAPYNINMTGSGRDFVDWNFGRAPSFMDVVCYTGTGANGQVINHNLSAIPEMVIIKGRDSNSDWFVYQAGLSSGNSIYLNRNYAQSNDGGPAFSLSTTALTISRTYVSNLNSSGVNYVAYLFATCAGVSKVGSYTGNGSTQTINCGFTGGARFVMVKATSTTGNWIVADSARGIVAGNDPALYLNSTAAEVTGLDWIDADNSGFVVNETATIAANTNGVSYIFFAVA